MTQGAPISRGLSTVSAGTYTNATITVDKEGRVTKALTGTGGGGGISSLIEDTTPQLGGTLDAQNNNIIGANTITGASGVTIASANDGNIVMFLDGNGDFEVQTDGGSARVVGSFAVSDVTTFGTTSLSINPVRLSVDGDSIEASNRGNVRLKGGDTNLEDESAGRVILAGGDNTFHMEPGYAGVNGGGGGGFVTVNRGDSSQGGSVTLDGGDGFNEGKGGDVVFNPGVVNGSNAESITGTRGRTKTQRGAFRVTVYANTTIRDTDIADPGEGDICFVSNIGLQVYDTTNQWVTLQGVA